MIHTIYCEHAIAEHPVTERIRQRFPRASWIPIERYGEVFNRRAQNFRLQKRRPALILAQKHGQLVLPAPPGYGIGHARNFYMSHMLNCVYDCRYCFLQGMYRSAHYVLFVNFEDFQTAMAETLVQQAGASTCFFSGYDCDSLALEPVSAYIENLLPFFEQHPEATLELRTKSTQIRGLLKRPALPNVIVAFSFTPAELAAALEHKTPGVTKRLAAMVQLQAQGWPLGLRFDPLLYDPAFEQRYQQLFQTVFEQIDGNRLHSISFGPFRLPRDYFRTLTRLYPDEPLLAAEYSERDGMLSYPAATEQAMRAFCQQALSRYVPDNIIFPCDF